MTAVTTDAVYLRWAVHAVRQIRRLYLLVALVTSSLVHPNHWCGISGYLDDDRCVEDKTRQEMFEEAGITADRILIMQRGTVLLQAAQDHGKSWLVVPVLVRVRDRRYRLDWESQVAGWFTRPKRGHCRCCPASTRSRDLIAPD